MGLFYRPGDGVAGDFVPFYAEGLWHLFYLVDYRDPAAHGEGMPWFHLVSRDLVHFEDWGEALPRGAADEQDLNVFTGSVLAAEGRYHIYYTGHNARLAQQGRPSQGIMRATSDDLRSWHKDDLPPLFAPTELGYERDDWRDPFVFWNEEAGEYWMLLAARRAGGPWWRYRGCTALATSRDLATWQVREPFWAPQLYGIHECPDLFCQGDWWYLFFSTFSERQVTHYRMSRSLQGPWLAPPNDTLDAQGHYAAKTASNGQERYLFGWLPTREGETDAGRWQWGGNLVIHQVVTQDDGTLSAKPPESLLRHLRGRSLPLAPRELIGAWRLEGDAAWTTAADPVTLLPGAATGAGRGATSAMLSLGECPEPLLLEACVRYQPGTQACGLLLRMEHEREGWYEVRLEPARQRVVIDRWHRPGTEPFVLEQPLPMVADRPVQLRAIVDGECLVAYADDRVALSCRMYDHPRGPWGLFVREGAARFEGLAAHTPA